VYIFVTNIKMSVENLITDFKKINIKIPEKRKYESDDEYVSSNEQRRKNMSNSEDDSSKNGLSSIIYFKAKKVILPNGDILFLKE
jgi:hypothetical protein